MVQGTYKIGIDLGGTKTETILFSPDEKVLYRHRVPTPRGGHAEYEGILDTVCRQIQATTERVRGHAYTIGIGIPGTFDPHTQTVQNANTTCLSGRSFKRDVEHRIGRSVGMENDANCFTLAEAVQGAARGYRLVFGMILGTGCGGGICLDGKIHHGTHMIAGEWGHFSVDPQGARCWCGNRGCIETKLSGTGVSNGYYRAYGERLSLQEITRRHRLGDENCRRIFNRFLDDFGRCVGGIVSTLDPDAVVIGGGVSNIEELYSEGVENVRRYAFHRNIRTPILKHQLGDSAGVYGAAWIGV
jgi:fructokinase